MTHHVLVAEPDDELWTSIAHGVSRYLPQASLLRVKDGEQALRFLFHRGLLAEEPETPQWIVLNAQLPIVPLNLLIARLRQHPRTCSIPLIVVRRETGIADSAGETRQWLHRERDVIAITGTQRLEREVADAMHRLSVSRPLFAVPGNG